MKFLGIRNHHDANVTYTDGTKVRYLKFERNLQSKHYSLECYDTIRDMEIQIILRKTREILGIDFHDLDGIAFSLNHPTYGNNYLQPWEKYALVNKKVHTFWNSFSCPVYAVDHHWAHALSCWPLVNVDKIRNHLVIDGVGDHGRFFSLYRVGHLTDFIENRENQSLSLYLNYVGDQMEMSGMMPDFAGKLMALKDTHKVSEEFENEVYRHTQHLKFRHMAQFIEIVKQKQKDPESKQGLIDLMYLLHSFAADTLPEYLFTQTQQASTEIFTYSGGTAQNIYVNTALRKRYPNVVIPPHCPDDGISLGCVEFLRQQFQTDPFDGSGFPYWQSDEAPTSTPDDSTIQQVAEYLAKGKIVGWYQGNGEIGPRALGNRSILMDPTIRNGKDKINERVKHRESYRPFGATVLRKHVTDLFEENWHNPYMLFAQRLQDRERYASISHLDGTCRPQTLTESINPHFHSLLDRFHRLTGVPALLNTSLNVNGKPIAGRVKDATQVFNDTDLDVLVIGNEIQKKGGV